MFFSVGRDRSARRECPAARSRKGRVGAGPCRHFPAFPLGGRYPSAHTGGNEGACGHSAASASDTPRGTSGLWSQCPWGMADEACPPQGSGPIFTARRVWKSVCRNESTRFCSDFRCVGAHRPLIRHGPLGRATFPPKGKARRLLLSFAIHPALAGMATVFGPPGASDGPRGTSGCRNQCPWGSRRPLRCNHNGVGFLCRGASRSARLPGGNDEKGNRWFGNGHIILRRGGALLRPVIVNCPASGGAAPATPCEE